MGLYRLFEMREIIDQKVWSQYLRIEKSNHNTPVYFVFPWLFTVVWHPLDSESPMAQNHIKAHALITRICHDYKSEQRWYFPTPNFDI